MWHVLWYVGLQSWTKPAALTYQSTGSKLLSVLKTIFECSTARWFADYEGQVWWYHWAAEKWILFEVWRLSRVDGW